MKITKQICLTLLFVLIKSNFAAAHDPVFSVGPHVLFKDGIELHGNISQNKSGDDKKTAQTFAMKYGITGDWVAGIDLPYKQIKENNEQLSGIGDIELSTKYRFWRKDSLAQQESVAFLLKIKLDSADNKVTPNAVDSLFSLAYGYESIHWYRWASVRYRFNGEVNQDNYTLERGNKTFVDLVLGYRHTLNGYRDPDMVYMVELNGEFSQRNFQRDNMNNDQVNDSGGEAWFISPGFMWTLRNMAVKGGIQLPIYSNLNGAQQDSDYRFKLSIEWHL